MSNVLGGGDKFHLLKYKGVFIVDGNAVLRSSLVGRSNKACGGIYTGQMNAEVFGGYRRSNPEWCCKKCIKIYDNLINESKNLKGE